MTPFISVWYIVLSNDPAIVGTLEQNHISKLYNVWKD